VTHCELVWVVKDSYIGNTFFDASASAFILPQLEERREVKLVEPIPGGGGGGGGGKKKSRRSR